LLAALPAAAAAAGGIFLLNRRLRQQEENLKAVNDAFTQLERDAAAASVGRAIRSALNEIRQIGGQISEQFQRGVEASDAQIARIEQLKNRIRELRGEQAERTRVAREVKAAQDAQGVSVENLIARLEREGRALQSLSQESENAARAQEEIQRLLAASQVPTAEERERIRNLIDANSALSDQRRILQEIQGPQMQFERDQAAIQALIRRFPELADQLNAKLKELREELEDSSGAGETAQRNALQALQAQNNLLDVRLRQGEIAANALRIENQLREDGIVITDEVRANILEQVLEQQKLNTELERRNKLERDAKRVVDERMRQERQEQARVERLAMQINVASQLEQQEARLQAARDQGLITIDQQAQALADLQLRGLESSTALGDGFARAFAKIEREALNLAAVGESVVNVFADQATNALVEFTETGQFSFKEFANAILADLTRIIARLLVVQALNAAFGGGAGTVAGAGASLAGSRQQGGTVQPARSFLVGENGPELFVPNRTGTIVPNQRDQQPPPQPMTVQVVNVKDPNEVPKVIASGAATEAIINELAANKDRVQQAIT
jgi:hypothetical protein